MKFIKQLKKGLTLQVLLANKFFYPKGGDAIAFFSTADILKKNGHDVSFFSMQSPQNLNSPYSRYFVSYVNMEGGGLRENIKMAGKILYSFEAKNKISELIKKQHPDIAHLHNICHQISPSVLDVLKKQKIPVVMTMHDYKLTCAAYTLLANGSVCEACSGGRYYQAFIKKCIKGSRLKSAVNVAEMYLHHRILHLYEKVDIFISPSSFLIEKTKEMGFQGKFVHLPNFVDTKIFEEIYDEDINNDKNRSVVYFGRLTSEKGLYLLLEAAKLLHEKNDIAVKIIGEGPMKEALEKKAEKERIPNVKFLGYMTGKDLYQEIKKSILTILPSEWYENNPLSVLESFAMGIPVIGARIGGIPELVKENKTGLTFEPGNAEDLYEKITTLLDNDRLRIEMGENARKYIETELNPDKHYQKLMEIYKSAMENEKI